VLQSFRERNINHDIVDGYYGTLIGMFECDKTFFTCVEVTAGGRWVLKSCVNCVKQKSCESNWNWCNNVFDLVLIKGFVFVFTILDA